MASSVLVAGGGIIGSSLALQLARRGVKATVIDPTPCGAPGATACSWAWLNANKKNPRHYKELNMKGMQEWGRSFPHLVEQRGAILLDDPVPSTDPNYPCEALSPDQLQRRERSLSAEALAGRTAHLYAQEAWVDPQRACHHMLDEAGKLGMQLVRDKVQALLTAPCSASTPGSVHSQPSSASSASRVVGLRTSAGQELTADVVVLACGPAIMGLAAQEGVQVPMLHKPARVTLTTALPPMLKAMVCAKDVFVMQRPDGTFMLGEPYETLDEDTSAPVGEMMMERAVQLVPALRNAKVTSVEIGYRPYPKDGHPIIGKAAEGLYICTTHSGMSLAPYVTKLAAQEVAGEELADDLAPYRPQRSFGDGSAAYGWDLYHQGHKQAEKASR